MKPDFQSSWTWMVAGACLTGLFLLNCGKDIDVGEAPESSGDGVVRLGGEALPYTVDLEQTKLLMRVLLVDDCSLPMHNHVVESTSNDITFELDLDDPSSSTFSATVYVAGLTIDDPENSALYPETENNEFTESDTESIAQSMYEQVKADEYDSMTFGASSLSTLNGEGTATITVNMIGITSTLTMTGSASMDDGGTITISASGTLDGEPFGIYSGFGSSCVSPLMPMDFSTVLVPKEDAAAGVERIRALRASSATP